MTPVRLENQLLASSALGPGRPALEELSGAACTYGQLHARAGEIARVLVEAGVRPGDRVGLCLQKSIDSVAAIFAVLMCEAAYVPVDAAGPLERAAFILADCRVRAVVAERDLVDGLRTQLEAAGAACGLVAHSPGSFTPAPGAGKSAGSGRRPGRNRPAAGGRDGDREDPGSAPPERLACILYTSGSTGRPKGVMLTHRNAGSFVDWCSEAFQPSEGDCFSSHAPFHFDLSILDIFLAVKHGARIVLFNSAEANDPRLLARTLAEREITLWYSTPSVLQAIASHGRMERYDFGRLHTVLFAGEVFPPDRFESFRQKVPLARCFNLYGPTETNVCTFHEVPDRIAGGRGADIPIGRPCSHMRTRIVGAAGRAVARGRTGELLVAGEAVMAGYWGRPAATRRALVRDADGVVWYRTGDLAHEDEAGLIHFEGRRDRMVKKRGYRVELAEIERCLRRHEQVESVATVAVSNESRVRIAAFYVARGGRELSPLRLREFVGGNLPSWMMPDEFVGVSEMPRTSTHKTDYRKLVEMLG